MLELKGIKKNYLSGENTVYALKGIDLKFRSNEFVAILGPSGCGKTTTLNIIGGLDRYTEGDLIINGRSTKEFKDRDWDAYRNHSCGFVFQSYNLIPHQTVLQNVEIALTLSGVSKNERRERAKKALEQVGLGNQFNKRPSEMSGGQMQRVAIARAIVNDPDIILADEPTGALDTKTSIQVMDILKEISKDRLVIMVTHNPELAEQYSARIVRMIDGEITEDPHPMTEKEVQVETVRDETIRDEQKGKKKMPSMKFSTSFGLSLKNLFTKKGRTALTSFAGSIGIIGIALIYSVSQGFQTYIDTIQEETLSSYPLTIQQTNTNLSALIETFANIQNGEPDHDKDAVYKRSAVYEIMNAINNTENSENDLKSFKAYIDEKTADDDSKLSQALSGVQYTYDYDMLVYTKNVDGDIIISDSEELMQELISETMNVDMSAMSQSSSSGMSSLMGGSMTGMSTSLWQEMLPGKDGSPINSLINKQYDVVYGSMPNSFDEIVLVLDENNELNDMALYALGLESKDEVMKIMDAAQNGTIIEMKDEKWSYEDICNTEYRLVLNSDCYSYDETTGTYHDLRDTDTGMSYLYENAIPLKVTGIIRPKEDATAAMLTGSIAYTAGLTEYIAEHSKDSDIISAQLNSENIDVITGLPFKSNTADLSETEKAEEFRAYLGALDTAGKGAAYIKMISVPSASQLEQMTAEAMQGVQREDMEAALSQGFAEQMGMSEDDIKSYLAGMSDDDIAGLYTMSVQEQIKLQFSQQAMQSVAQMSPEDILAAYDQLSSSLTDADCAYYYDSIMEFSNSSLESNLRSMGYIDLDDPYTVNLYASSFENKDVIEDVIKDYNKGKDELGKIKYTDYIGLMMSSITTIINAITYVLIAFVSISLIVSSIMIAVITLISVQERTKEIGILRAIGASKRNVSNMFNAETMLIGFTSGLLGVVVSALMTIPINAVIRHLTGINNLRAILPIGAAIILITISVILNLISGLIPSRSAAKKDPVVALRSE